MPGLRTGALGPEVMDTPMTGPSPRRTVLVIEDDRDIAEAIADLLREVNRDVVIARDGE